MMTDSDAAKAALELLNGYNLRGKPVIIEYARGSKSPSLPLVAKPGEKAPIRSRKRKSLGKDIIP
jgi:RNA recognition motif-containing protein